ncbi:MAG TPA: methyltransferase domain-containing protein [Gemmatimonadaceae bacterium]|nr:methyltransferase domain-containing protein [Gemmatimonadaceae bacterium]
MASPFDALQRLIRSVVPIRLRGVPGRARWLNTRPLSDSWGFERGTPIDRHFIEAFLTRHAADVRGRVLEIKSSAYTERIGRNVTARDVLDIDATNTSATLVADLANTESLPEGRFDCFILTQTLQLIYDVRAAIASTHRVLRPGGTVLVTVPCISRIIPRYGLEADYWRFTVASCRRLFGDVFGAENVSVESSGNVAAAVAFLRGAAVEEVPAPVLEASDPYFPVIITVRAVRR